MTLAVVVPAYNESAGFAPTLEALAAQTVTDFALYVVDNASTDATRGVVEGFARDRGLTRWRVIERDAEGHRRCGGHGHARRHRRRPHADRPHRRRLPPAPADWLQRIVTHAGAGLDFISGKVGPRRDDVPVSAARAALMRGAVSLGAFYGRHLRRENRGPEYLGPYIMTAGCNLAITAELYERCGGFPRTAIEEAHEDRALINAVRRVTTRYAYCPDVRVLMSARRVNAWGLANTLRWYRDHSFKGDTVDIR